MRTTLLAGLALVVSMAPAAARDALPTWCTGGQHEYLNFQLDDGRVASICESDGWLMFTFGRLDEAPVAFYSGRQVAAAHLTAQLTCSGHEEAWTEYLTDLAAWAQVDAMERDLLLRLAAAGSTNGFLVLSGLTGLFSSTCYVFRHSGWTYAIDEALDRTHDFRFYSITRYSPDGEEQRFEQTYGENPYSG